MQGFVIAGTHSGCGKTTITLGIMAALLKKGLTIQGFKSGPDFIDTGLHKLATGRISRNLDLWMCGEDYVRSCFHQNASSADVAVVEGVMGLYDGTMSTAHLAQTLELPVILVVDAYGMAESAGSMVKGFLEWPLPHNSNKPVVKGVIFNRVGSDHHYRRLCSSVSDVPVLGYLSRDVQFEIPHRHLGLIVAEEDPVSRENMDRLADSITSHVDLDKLLALDKKLQSIQVFTPIEPVKPKIRLAVAADKTFCFYYEDNLDLLRQAGAELVFFSPLSDRSVPDNVDGIYFGGGYPELYAEELSRKTTMRASVKSFAETGKPIYGECGGLMYLSNNIKDFDGRSHEMAGCFTFSTFMTKGRAHLGYREIALSHNCLLGNKGDIARGHEFHYSAITKGEESIANTTYVLKNGLLDLLGLEGYRYKNVLGSYVHVHFGSNPSLASRFIEFCQKGRM